MDKRFTEPHSHPRWWWDGNYVPACFDCKHFSGAHKGKIVCKAYPDGIPKPFMLKGFIHDKPYPGDNGILFEQIEEEL